MPHAPTSVVATMPQSFNAVNERDLMKAVLKRPISGDIFDKIECHVPDPILKNTFKLEKKPNNDVVLVGYGTREGVDL
ncbi:hypothetical protein TSUD_346940 [Trifolium subterraneum]|nr:hypothetical protein TSUD_346940 [Trifolium subterraneum]